MRSMKRHKMVNRACNGCLTRASTYTVPSACSLRTSVTERPRTWSTRCQCDAMSVTIRRLDLRSVSSSTAAAETRVIHYIAHWQSLCCLGLAGLGAVLVTGICLRQFSFFGVIISVIENGKLLNMLCIISMKHYMHTLFQYILFSNNDHCVSYNADRGTKKTCFMTD